MHENNHEYHTFHRQEFRRRFQPSRIVLCILPDQSASGVNVITLCFDMYCSYKPPMMAFSVHESAYSYGLAKCARECVLSVPGESLAPAAMFCGTESGRNIDKVEACGLRLMPSETVSVPGICGAIANIELTVSQHVTTGDHLTVIGEVRRFAVATENSERCLLSIGPEQDGYEVLERNGIHRIGVVAK